MPRRFNPTLLLFDTPRAIIGRGFLLLLILSLLTGGIAAQSEKETLVLETGNPIERELTGEQAHPYHLTLKAGQYVHVVVTQRGIDVILTLFAPDGKKLIEIDSPGGTEGPEILLWIAESSGTYRLEVSPLDKKAAAGRYQVNLKESRAATTQDADGIAAQELFIKGLQLAGKGSKASLEEALPKLEQALRFFHSVNDTVREALTLHSLGSIYNSLGEKQKALDNNMRAVLLLRAAGNRQIEALTLYSIGRIYSDLGEKQKALDNYIQALPLWRATAYRQAEAFTLSNIGKAYSDLGERQKALDHYSQALALFRALGDRSSEANTLIAVTPIYINMGEKQKALDYFAQALPLFRALGDRRSEAFMLATLGYLYSDLGQKQKALEHLGQALPLSRAISDRLSEATALIGYAVVYITIGEFQKALDYLEQALPLCRAIGDRRVEARALNYFGMAYDGLSEKQKALDNYTRALSLFRAIGESAEESSTLSNIGRIYSTLGEKQKALDFFNQALQLSQAIGNRQSEALALNNVGTIYDDLGEKQKALDYYARALALWRDLGARQYEVVALNNIGKVSMDLGEKQKALDYFAQALPLFRAIGDRRSEVITLNNIGQVYAQLGEYQKALDHLDRALPLNRAIGDRQSETLTLNNIGMVYFLLGEKYKALDYFNQALPLSRAIGYRQGEALTLNNIGAIYDDLGEKQKAIDYLAQALPLVRVVGDRQSQASLLNNIGKIYMDSGDKQKALDYINQALPLSRSIGYRQGEALALNSLGFIYYALGEKQKALDYYAQALALFRSLGGSLGETVTLSSVGMIERDQGNLLAARANIEAAISIIESLRTKVTNQELRASFFATMQDYYGFYVDLLMRLHKQHPNDGYDGEAFRISERTRARALLETLMEANADIRQGIEPALVERERALQSRLNAQAQAQMKLLGSPHTEAQANASSQEIEALTTEFQQIETQIRQTSPRYAALTQPQLLSLKEIQTQVLDADSLLLEYSLGRDQSYVWAVTPVSIVSYQLPKREEIETAARLVYNLLNARNKRIEGETPEQRKTRITESDAQYAEAAARLSRLVLAPVAGQLGTKRLLIVSDGALQYIPFAALPGPPNTANSKSPLVVKHEIVSLPSASTISVLRREIKDRRPAVKTVAVLADPVFEETDERVNDNAGKAAGPAGRRRRRRGVRRELPMGLERSAQESGLREAGLEIPRLPGTRLEARRILALVPTTESKRAFDFEANRATATSVDLSQYRYVHFATHGFLNSLHPELSGIVLSMVDKKGNAQDGFLRAHEIFNLKLSAELVVLSACQTGLGKEIKGEGLVGLTRGFMYAGAPRVVVSLWSVSDAATAELMTSFYRAMLKEGKRPAAAMREAQILLLKNKRWESPFYWAAFTLQGEWR